MAPRHSNSNRGLHGASTCVRIAVGLLPAARRSRLEPHFVFWSICRYLAGESQYVDIAQLRQFIVEHKLWSLSRFNALLREGEDTFWLRRTGRLSGSKILRLKGLPHITSVLLQQWKSSIKPTVAYLPIDTLKGVSRRRGSAYEALVGKADSDKGQPRSRIAQQVQTGVPASTQRRWNVKAGTERIPTVLSLGEVSNDYRLDTKYLDEPGYRVIKTNTGERHLVRQTSNITTSRFEAHRSRSLRKSISRALLVNGGSDRTTMDGSNVRYANSAAQGIRLAHKGFQPRTRLCRAVMDQRPCWMYQTEV